MSPKREIIFAPELTPKEMLSLGVFGGAYFEDSGIEEYPADWFTEAKISTDGFDVGLNRFGVAAGQSRAVWQEKGWITTDDPLGWFQWYCRYSLGRRIPGLDAFQIRRWYQFGARHVPQIKKNCEPGNVACRPRQRQAVLQWSYDPFV